MRPSRLITIPMSHYCERARWALDHTGVPYRQEGHLQGLHYAATHLAGGRSTVPVLITPDGDVLADSADIVQWASRNTEPGRALYPSEPHERSEVERKEHWLANQFGPYTRRWTYALLLYDTSVAMHYATYGIPVWQRRSVPLMLPFVRQFLSWRVGITEELTLKAEVRIDTIFDAVAEILEDGRPFLCGEQFTAADITFAAMSAAILLPSEYGIPLPTIHEVPERGRARIAGWREHPAGQFALGLFRRWRYSSSPGRASLAKRT